MIFFNDILYDIFYDISVEHQQQHLWGSPDAFGS